jgi:hypothetical protein
VFQNVIREITHFFIVPETIVYNKQT